MDKEKRFSLKELQSALMQYLLDGAKVEKVQVLTNQEKKIANELQYIRLIEYIQLISTKCRKNDSAARINYLF